MVTDLGKISCTPRGEWVNSEEYDVLDIVRYSGAAYISLSKPPAGTLPTNITYWMKLVKDGTGATIDTAMSSTSENPVQNKVITEALNRKLSEVPTMSDTVKGGAKVGDGLQMTGDVLSVESENDWELIETINGAEAVIERTSEPDGTIYKFSAIALKITCEGTPQDYESNIDIYSGTHTQLANIYLTTTKQWGLITAKIANGRCNIETSRWDNKYLATQIYTTGWRYKFDYADGIDTEKLINKIKTREAVATGITIEVWAVR